MIDVQVVISGINIYMTFIYGNPVLERRNQVWDCLTCFSTTKDGPWFTCLMGNHRSPQEKGGRKRSDTYFLFFNQMISDCGMLEFPCTGNQLSWAGKRANGTILCRLDRVLDNENWHEKFPHSNVQYLRMWESDNCPVLADILSKPTKKKKAFKYDKCWLESEEIPLLI